MTALAEYLLVLSIFVHVSRLSFALFNSSSVLSFGLEVKQGRGGSSRLKAIFWLKRFWLMPLVAKIMWTGTRCLNEKAMPRTDTVNTLLTGQ